MRRTLALLVLAALTTPAHAIDSGRKPVVDFAAYSIFIVANDNCDDLHFDAQKLKAGMEGFADSLKWGVKKRRLQAQSMVADNKTKLEADRLSFCRSAKTLATRYASDGIRY